MKQFVLNQSDIDALLAAIDRDPAHGYQGGCSMPLTTEQRLVYEEAHRFFNYQVRTWVGKVTS